MYKFFQYIYRLIIPEFLRRFLYWHGNYSKMRRIQNREPFLTYNKKNIIFIHIPKTGGLSIAFTFFGLDSSSHSTYHNYSMLWGKKRMLDMVTFSFVRNPWDRIHSAYYYLKSQNPETKLGKKVIKELELCHSFEMFILDWLNEEKIKIFPHFLPQSEFILDYRNKLRPDYIGRYEFFSEHVKKLGQILNLHIDICHRNAGPFGKKNYQKEYTEEMIYKVSLIYAKDIEVLGYTFDNCAIDNNLIIKHLKT